jgi:hypothetical protein
MGTITDSMNSNRIIKEYHEPAYTHKYDNFDEIQHLFEKHFYQNSYKVK